MLEHEFCVGKEVDFSPGRGVDGGSRGHFTIVRFLPIEGSMPQYRIRNNADGQERMVREDEIGAHRFLGVTLATVLSKFRNV
jgi:hypothetical protein